MVQRMTNEIRDIKIVVGELIKMYPKIINAAITPMVHEYNSYDILLTGYPTKDGLCPQQHIVIDLAPTYSTEDVYVPIISEIEKEGIFV
jgi:hypothetical protein